MILSKLLILWYVLTGVVSPMYEFPEAEEIIFNPNTPQKTRLKQLRNPLIIVKSGVIRNFVVTPIDYQ